MQDFIATTKRNKSAFYSATALFFAPILQNSVNSSLSRPQNQFKFNDQQKQSQKPSRNVKENASLWHHSKRFEQPFKFRTSSKSRIVEQMHFCSDIIVMFECKLRDRRGKHQNSVMNLNKIPIIHIE